MAREYQNKHKLTKVGEGRYLYYELDIQYHVCEEAKIM